MTEREDYREWISSALEYSRDPMTLEDIEEGLECGEYLLFLERDGKLFLESGESLRGSDRSLRLQSDSGSQAALITETFENGGEIIFRIVAIGGKNMKSWIGLLPELEQWARERGCTMIDAWCRKGWMKVLKGYNMTPIIGNLYEVPTVAFGYRWKRL